VITWPEKEFTKLTAAFVRCNKEDWQMLPNTFTALFAFPKDLGGLQIKLPRAILCSATWGHLTQCCQFDDGTRQLAEITYKVALEKYGCLDMEDLLSFPRKNAELNKKFCTRLIRQATQCTAAVFQPTWRTPRVHHKKGRPRAATSHESRPGKPSFCTSGARTITIVRSGTDNSIEQRAWQALRTLS